MANIANPGYLGIAVINSVSFRCTDISLVPSQDVVFYDHTVGLKDTVPAKGAGTKGASNELNYINKQKIVWRGSTISYAGSISFPVTNGGSDCTDNESNLPIIFNLAKYGNSFDIFITYNCLEARTFRGCKINTLSLSMTAGDIVTVTANIIAMDVEDSDPGDLFQVNQKMITWDKVILTAPQDSIDVSEAQAFSIEINNNIKTIYTHNNLKPRELRLGMQEVRGSITLYNNHGYLVLPLSDGDVTLGLNIFDLTTDINCVLQPSAINGAISSIFSVIPFVGVDRPFGV